MVTWNEGGREKLSEADKEAYHIREGREKGDITNAQGKTGVYAFLTYCCFIPGDVDFLAEERSIRKLEWMLSRTDRIGTLYHGPPTAKLEKKWEEGNQARKKIE